MRIVISLHDGVMATLAARRIPRPLLREPLLLTRFY
jgi:hypothetical protein